MDTRPKETGHLILAQGSILADVPFEECVAAAAAGGFTSIGFSLCEYDRLRAHGTSDADMLCTLAVYGVQVSELEAVHGFAAERQLAGTEFLPSLRHSDESTLERLFRLADLSHARHLQTTGTFGSEVLEHDAVKKFAQLCGRAASTSCQPRVPAQHERFRCTYGSQHSCRGEQAQRWNMHRHVAPLQGT